MNTHHLDTELACLGPCGFTTDLAGDLTGPARAIERLPFKVRVVRDDAALRKAVKVREEAYRRHLPAFADTLKLPEPDDTADDCVVLLAEARSDGRALGSMRVQFNEVRPLHVERITRLPDWLAGQRQADARRLGVAQGMDAGTVRIALFKAYFLLLQQQQVAWSVVTARHPLTRIYEHLLFRDILGGATVMSNPAMNAPHKVLALDIAGLQAAWTWARHPLTSFFFHTVHPDIEVNGGAAVLQ